MPKAKLFELEESEEEVSIKTENEYAKKYDAWREKEELHKLEQKYGSKPLYSEISLSSDSEDESDEPPEVSEEVEKQFLKTLALLKTKDPRIYDSSYKFFDDKIEKEKEKEPETKKLTFGDSDDDDDEDDPNIFSIEKKAEIDNSDDKKISKDMAKDEKIKDFLTGKAEHVDEEVVKDLAPLRALWSDPKLNDGEAFLRDYILNKRYLEEGDPGDAGDKIRDDDDLEEDEKTVEEQGKFERAYNFRFEEPDEEYLKRFPRTMNYIRPKDDRRSRKRAEIRARKEEEKNKKIEEIARMKALKLKEIQEKIAKIKEITGNKDLAFKDEDIEGDFDPEDHDRRMKALFDEEYYGEIDDQKPVFPDLDDELEIENWENYEQDYDRNNVNEDVEMHCEDKDFIMDADYDPKKAKENLLDELKRNMGNKRRNRKRKSKLAELLSEEKPKFVPDLDKTYSEFMKEYYAMDCEDVIGGDLPTRFKYREVVPNDFGLTVEEILLADDKELTQWVPLKKLVKYRPENVEKGEVKVYLQKASDVNLKKKILPSLFKDLPEEPELVVPIEATKKKKKKKKPRKENIAEDKGINEGNEDIVENSSKNTEKKKLEYEENGDDKVTHTAEEELEVTQEEKKTKKKNKTSKKQNSEELNEVIKNEDNVPRTRRQDVVKDTTEIDQERKKFKKKHKKVKKQDLDDEKGMNNTSIDDNTSKINIEENNNTSTNSNVQLESKKKKNIPKNSFNIENITNKQSPSNAMSNRQVNNLKRKLDTNSDIPKKKKKKKNKQQTNSKETNNSKDIKKLNAKNKSNKRNDNADPLSKLSDERLKAYGLNPKKYRGFLKYKKF